MDANGLTERATAARNLPDREYVSVDAVQSEYAKHAS